MPKIKTILAWIGFCIVGLLFLFMIGYFLFVILPEGAKEIPLKAWGFASLMVVAGLAVIWWFQWSCSYVGTLLEERRMKKCSKK